jgi:type IV pilus assembly protein PilB
MSTPKRKRLGEILIDENLVLPEQLEVALERQKDSGRRLGQILIDMGFVSNDDLLSAISMQTGVPHVWLRQGMIDPKIVDILTKEKADDHCVMPMFKVHHTLTLGMADASDLFVIDDLEALTGCKIQPVQCRREDIETAIRQYYSESLDANSLLQSMGDTNAEAPADGGTDLQMVGGDAEGNGIINLVNMILLNAINDGVSDIHVEADTDTTRVRYRVDGVLKEVMTPRADLHPAIVSRVKVMSKMDIAERRLPQDGRIQVSHGGKDVDLRVSTMPTVLGEKIVIRLLDKTGITLDIDRIGFHGETLTGMKALLSRPHGILLVTGPTGSGKTTTLYSGLNYISSVERNITTVEDPVEFQLPLINQIQVNEEQGLSFARALRSVLRQDPDVIMVGEIRDRDTAEVAIQAALTGHLVLSTLHTNESAGAIARLIEMDIEPFLLTSSIGGILAQRLVRTVCPDCCEPYTPAPELLDRIGWDGDTTTFMHGAGCDACFHTGMRGRTPLYELLTMNDVLRETILRDPSSHAIRNACRQTGTLHSMRDDAFRLLADGRTSLEEVMRVITVRDTNAELAAVGS